MEFSTWAVTALHELGIIITGAAAVIAATSSLRNGRTLKNGGAIVGAVVRREMSKPSEKKTSKDASEDWYKPPDLD